MNDCPIKFCFGCVFKATENVFHNNILKFKNGMKYKIVSFDFKEETLWGILELESSGKKLYTYNSTLLKLKSAGKIVNL